MDLVYLSKSYGWHEFPLWGQVLFIVGAVLVAATVIGVMAWGVALSWMSRERKIRGPVLTGTAQILSAKDTRWEMGSHGQERVYKIGLRVQIPGREPYDVRVYQHWGSALEPGETWSVQVSAANPRRVRIVSFVPDKPVTPQVGSLGSTYGAQQLSVLAQLRDRGELTDAEFEAVKNQLQQMPGSRVGPTPKGADLLASGQRVSGVLMSFAANGDRADSTYSRAELRGAPYYLLAVELHIPNLAPMTARNIQPVPAAMVPKLTLGLQLTCAVDPADPTNLFTVDWDAIAH